MGKGIPAFPRSIIELYYHANRDKYAFCLLGKYKGEGGGSDWLVNIGSTQ